MGQVDTYEYLFDEKELNTDIAVSGRVQITNNKRQQRLIERLAELKSVMPEIEPQTSYHLISSDNFGSIEILKLLIERERPTEIHITTWSYNEDFVDVCRQCLESGITIYFFVDKSIKTRKAHLYAQMVDLSFRHENLQIKIHHMLHSKVTLIKGKHNHISIEGSANYSKNQRIENFTITESKDLYLFHRNWMNEIIGK